MPKAPTFSIFRQPQPFDYGILCERKREQGTMYWRRALERPDCAALDQARRDIVELGPAIKATVGRDHRFDHS
jgi:hypothetical protein